ncbi:NAD(P)-dependent oxidoreductase [Sediminicola luteus]|uniref:Saccharopine dehydrogenase [NAD(+), L-lysine-forming] n=1 Tax=Sediminicola luteus TaxID=319238 RepID=A0A2A4G8X7_9FLAO|nr:NAD(P)-dependent oxidoreductase [Sediminicola luteus]PCE64438.1 alanine dehydrogenase [Sediminicola luteus]
MKLGVIKERKNPPDRRVVLSPAACQAILERFPEAEIIVEPSDIRVYTDADYRAAGVTVADAMDQCDVLLGVKEVPIDALIPNKKYFFFSHTIKKQPYNKKLLQAILAKHIELYDHEVIVNQAGQRVVAFGRYAGIVGAYNGFRAYGLKHGLFELPKAETLPDQQALINALRQIKEKLGGCKIVLTGKGKVGNGAREMLVGMGLTELDVNAYLNQRVTEPVFCQIDVLDYNKRKDGQQLDKKDFYSRAEAYQSNFMRFAQVSDFYIAGHFFGDGAPFLFTREDAKSDDFNISVVADISCDIDGPVASTIRPSTIADPIYGYDAQSESEIDYRNDKAIAVMAVDNLPCELPRDASVGFGEQFMEHVIPAFFDNDAQGVLERARMTRDGKLTSRFSYLEDYISE